MAKSDKKVAAPKASKKESKKVEAPKAAAPVVEKKSKSSKKSKKEPTPPPAESSSSESESESDSSESESEEEDKVVAAAPASVTAPNGDFKPTKAEESSEESDSDDESSDEEPSKAEQVKAAPAKKDSDDESSESSDEDSSDEEEAAKPAAAAKESESSEESSDEESSEEESSDEEEAAPVTNGKRKASEEAAAPTKKAKTENGAVAKTNTEQGEGEASKNVFVGSLSWNVDNDWLQSEFQECGEIVSVRIMMDREKNRSRGFGYIEFADLEGSAKAVALNGKEIDGRPVNINYASARPQAQNTEKRAQQYGDKQNPPCTTLWVGNMAFSSNEDTLYNAFGEYGAVQSVRLPTDRETGAPKGFAYVQFETVESAQAALDAWKGQELDGRALRLDFAPPRDNDGQGGGGRGGRGGFGGDRGGRGGRGGGRGGFGGDRGGGRGGGRGGRGGRGGGAPRGNPRSGGIAPAAGKKISFD